MIDIFFEDYKVFELNKVKIENWIERVVGLENFMLGELSFIFCSDGYLLNINKEYLKHDYYTDVITFDYSQNTIVSGDIFISVDRVKDNAVELSEGFNDELLRIIIHGVLHLLKYKDKSKHDKLLMTSKEDEYLKLFVDVEGI